MLLLRNPRPRVNWNSFALRAKEIPHWKGCHQRFHDEDVPPVFEHSVNIPVWLWERGSGRHIALSGYHHSGLSSCVSPTVLAKGEGARATEICSHGQMLCTM